MSVPEPTKVPEAAAAPGDRCPKCATPARDTDSACRRCGLLRSRWATFQVHIASHPVLDPLWQKALESWDDPRGHAALAAAVGKNWPDLNALVQRYAGVLRERPKDPVATAALDNLIRIAMTLQAPTQIAARATAIEQGSKALLGLFLLLLTAFFLFRLLHC